MMRLVGEVGPEGRQGRNRREVGPEGQHVRTQSIKDQGSRIEDQGLSANYNIGCMSVRSLGLSTRVLNLLEQKNICVEKILKIG